MNNTIKSLWDSTEQLHHRFGLYPPKLPAVVRVMYEEFAEFTNAIYSGTEQEITHEGADLAVTICAVLMSAGHSFDSLRLSSPKASHNGYSIELRLSNLANNLSALTTAAYLLEDGEVALYASIAVSQVVSILNELKLYGDFEAAAADVIAKNDAKTTATHAVNEAGKIARRV